MRHLKFLFLIALVGSIGLLAPPHEAAVAVGGCPPSYNFSYLTPDFQQCNFITGLPSDAGNTGPVGFVFLSTGEVFVADYSSSSFYKFPATGGVTGPPLAPSGLTVGLTLGLDGKLYAASRAASAVLEINPTTGGVVRTVATGFPYITGLTTDPVSGDLFATNAAGGDPVVRVNPATGVQSAYVVSGLRQFGGPDGLVFDDAGVLYVAANTQVVKVDRLGNATLLANVPGGSDGLAVGKPGSAVGGSVFVNNNYGVVSRIDMTQTPATVSAFASGGTRGDLMAVDAQGFLYVTQRDSIIRISPAVFQPTPGNSPSLGSIQFSQSTYSTCEACGAVAVTVTRTGSTALAARATVSLVDGTALAGRDYVKDQPALGIFFPGPVAFAPGATSGLLLIPILNDHFCGPPRTFTLSLSNPCAGSSIGTPSVGTVAITAPLCYSVSGRVTDRSGAGVGGVRLDDGAGHSAVTDPLGSYILGGLPPGQVTLTPSSDGYLFTPATYAATTPPNLTGINFTASPARVVVLIAGIDSFGSCGLSNTEEPDAMELRIGGSVFGRQAQTGIRRFVTDSFQQFSYNGPLCGGASNAAIYSASATCGGVRDAAAKLQQMIAAMPPGTRVDVVGHSLGGMVAAYWATQQDQSFLASRVHSIVTLDSPLYGLPWRQFLLDRASIGIGKLRFVQPSACYPSSLSAGDIAGRPTAPSQPSVVSIIDDVRLTTSRVPFAGVKCTVIGALLPGQHAFIADTLTGPTDHTCGYTQATVLDQLAQWLLR